MQTAFMVIIVLIALVGAYTLSIYNKLVTFKNKIKDSWNDVEVQMKRRYNLISNLVETVKSYAPHEKNTLDAVIQARNAAVMINGRVEDKSKAETLLSSRLKLLFALSENYPNLKANDNFLELQKKIINVENKIQANCRLYNSNVLALNIRLELFPSNIVGQLFNFEKQALFGLAQ
jgi:LemA protein